MRPSYIGMWPAPLPLSIKVTACAAYSITMKLSLAILIPFLAAAAALALVRLSVINHPLEPNTDLATAHQLGQHVPPREKELRSSMRELRFNIQVYGALTPEACADMPRLDLLRSGGHRLSLSKGTGSARR